MWLIITRKQEAKTAKVEEGKPQGEKQGKLEKEPSELPKKMKEVDEQMARAPGEKQKPGAEKKGPKGKPGNKQKSGTEKQPTKGHGKEEGG